MGECGKRHFANVEFSLKGLNPIDEKGHRINQEERKGDGGLKTKLPISQCYSKLGLPHTLWVCYQYV